MMAASETNILDVREVYVHYGIVPALTDVSLYSNEGEIVTLLGANGAGKTSTLNAIYRVLPLSGGEICFCGRNINGLTPQELVGLGICYVPERIKAFDSMSVMDNLILGSYVRRRKGKKEEIEKDLISVFSLFPVLARY